MSTPIWIVLEYYIEDTYVRGVYTTEAAAEARLHELAAEDHPYSDFAIRDALMDEPTGQIG